MTLKKILLVAACLNIILVSACSSSSENPKVNLNEGRWEITGKMEMANLPFSMPPMTYTMCLTKEDLIPQQDTQAENNNCEITSQSINGDTVNWTVVCNSEQGKTTSSGTITYKGDSFTGKINMQMPGAGAINQSMTGRRIGDCQ